MDEAERRRRNDEAEERLRRQFERLSDAARSVLGGPAADPGQTGGQPGGAEDRGGGNGAEKLVGPHLDDLDGVVALHDRSVPGTGLVIDHLVVAPSGVWVIRARQAPGKVRRRHGVLHAGGQDRTGHVEVMAHQRDAVAVAVAVDGDVEVDVLGVLCLIDARWPLRSGPLRFDHVLVTWPAALLADLGRPGPLTGAVVTRLADGLHQRFPPRHG
jgi:hypothetical protein